MSRPLIRLACLSLLLATAPAWALDFSTDYNADAPRTPTAAIVLGFTPEDIQRPGSPMDAVAALGTSVTDADGIPDSFAMELMPYWLGTKAARDLDLRRYVNGGAQSLLQNFGVSAAIDQVATEADPEITDLRIGAGVHTTFWGAPTANTSQGRFAASWDKLFGTPLGEAPAAEAAPAAPTEAESKVDSCAASLEKVSGFAAWLNAKIAADIEAKQSANLARLDLKQSEFLSLCNSVNATLMPKAGAFCVDAGFLPAGTGTIVTDEKQTMEKLREIRDELEKAAGKVESDLSSAVKKLVGATVDNPKALSAELKAYFDDVGFDEAFDECGDLLDRREGFVLELAGGAGALSPEQNLAETGLSDWSAWVSPGWVAEHWSTFGLARLRGLERDGEQAMYLDAGAGFGYSWPVVTLGLQGLYGIPLVGDTPTAKVILSDDIRITSSVWFSSAFGATFPIDEPGSFLSFVSIKFAAQKKATLRTPDPTEVGPLLVSD